MSKKGTNTIKAHIIIYGYTFILIYVKLNKTKGD
jgi:hypothetical protein